jgi:tRNA G10  N-methylase Trm11
MWHSITPEAIAVNHARICERQLGEGMILDPFCGYGTDILYQKRGIFAIGCDINRERLIVAREINKRIGKSEVDFILSDFVRGRSCFRTDSCLFDMVHLSPPWGHSGIRNRKHEPVAFGSRRLHQLSVDGFDVFKRALKLARSDNIAYYLPRGIAESDLIKLATLTKNCLAIAAQAHYSYDPNDETSPKEQQLRVRGVTVYFGDLSKQFLNEKP